MVSLEGKKVLVTGAGGFIGEHLCHRLLTEGAELHGIIRKKGDNLSSGITWRFGDLADLSFTRDSISDINPAIIFHLASHVVGQRAMEAVQPTFHGNLHSTVNLLTAAAEVGSRRIIIVGSQEEPDFSESSQAVPSSPYAAAKWAASSYARMFHALYQTPVTIARVFMVYGPGQKDIRKLVPYTILSLINGIAPELTSGDRPIDWIYVRDVVEGLLSLAHSRKLDGRTVDLGSGSFFTAREIVEKIADLIDNDVYPQFGTVAQRPMEQVRKACSQETKELIGWQAKTSIADGLTATIQWYRGHNERNGTKP